MDGRRYSEGLHQAIEAKEGVHVKRENRTLATITFQNYFRMYEKLAGMTGTAATEAEELFKIYKLEVVTIPTNKPMIREDSADYVFKTEDGEVQCRRGRDRGAAGEGPAGPRRHRLGREERVPQRTAHAAGHPAHVS